MLKTVLPSQTNVAIRQTQLRITGQPDRQTTVDVAVTCSLTFCLSSRQMFSMASSDAFRTLIFASLERRRSMETTPLLSSRPINHREHQLQPACELDTVRSTAESIPPPPPPHHCHQQCFNGFFPFS